MTLAIVSKLQGVTMSITIHVLLLWTCLKEEL